MRSLSEIEEMNRDAIIKKRETLRSPAAAPGLASDLASGQELVSALVSELESLSVLVSRSASVLHRALALASELRLRSQSGSASPDRVPPCSPPRGRRQPESEVPHRWWRQLRSAGKRSPE